VHKPHHHAKVADLGGVIKWHTVHLFFCIRIDGLSAWAMLDSVQFADWLFKWLSVDFMQ